MAQKEDNFQREIVLSINFLLYLPKDYQQNDKSWPLILFLHGAGECGNNLEVVKRNGIPRIVEEVENFPLIAVSPQCPEGTWWGDHSETLIMLLDDIYEKYNVDKDKVYLTGLSMGGYGTWFLAAKYPKKFATFYRRCWVWTGYQRNRKRAWRQYFRAKKYRKDIFTVVFHKSKKRTSYLLKSDSLSFCIK